jgi:hypothetical protein
MTCRGAGRIPRAGMPAATWAGIGHGLNLGYSSTRQSGSVGTGSPTSSTGWVKRYFQTGS